MKLRSTLACLAATVSALAVSVLPAEAAGPRAISKCSDNQSYGYGTTITRDSYLTRNLTCQKGFVIANGATLNLRGHTLTGKPDPFSCVGDSCPDGGDDAQQPGHAAIVLVDGHVRNGRLDRWEHGIRVLPHTGPRTAAVSKMAVTNMSSYGFYATDHTDTVSISKSVFSRNGYGALAQYGGNYNIDRSAFVDNTSFGMEMFYGGDLKVTNSVFARNGGMGLGRFGGLGTTTLTGNAFNRNGNSGVDFINTDNFVWVRDNVANNNGGVGMLFITGLGNGFFIDQGGNRASGNAREPQCFVITCS